NYTIAGEKAHKTSASFAYFGLNNLVASLRKIENNTLRKNKPEIAAMEIEKIKTRIKEIHNQSEKLMKTL
ncbi:MAG: hypothetical protein PHX54_01550, partial [Lentimicrobiaceae bacterium]|nr:hypothetical protein [Lentimicrobiaceae bacterium]